MAELWQVRVYDNQQLAYSGQFSKKVELGRQSDPSERLYARKFDEANDLWRLVVAGKEEDSISRKHALLVAVGPGKVRVENMSTKVSIGLDNGQIEKGTVRELLLPLVLSLGRKTIRVTEGVEEPAPGSPKEATAPPMPSGTGFATIALPSTSSTSIDEIREYLEWLQRTMVVLQGASSLDDFYEKAAEAVATGVGLDLGMVLLRAGDSWDTKAVHCTSQTGLSEHSASKQVLAEVLRERRLTFYRPPQDGEADAGAEGASLFGLSAVVAAPILDENREVLGALYGVRRIATHPGLPLQINEFERMLVNLLATGVANGIARMESEHQAMTARVKFEQFFTPELARVIADRPELLEGQDAEISVLFADIRGFSGFSERLGPSSTVKWINHVMGELSDCVLEHDGVLVDYIGDMIMAMWGAPQARPDHAVLACRAALAMVARLPKLNDHWLPTLGKPMDIGIGINSGDAHVGNTGSAHKFKYGPLGNTVNLASRVEGMTKHLQSRLLVTEETRKRLGEEFRVRKVGQVRVVNIREPVVLYELADADFPRWDELSRRYEKALDHFEHMEFPEAAETLGALLLEHRDGPSLVLMSRAVNCLLDPEAFNPVLEPKTK